MGIVVGIAIVVVLGLIVAKGFASGDEVLAASQIQRLDEEDLGESQGPHKYSQSSGLDSADANYFDRLMTPGSNEAALHNAALDEGRDPENW